ncbi:tripartite tricarboxylate transporter permease [Limnochorda pilosa]|uniref:C4-dicarboxylate ABC transporter permease n=1 Tax=Limnochorda pilosa TaxID=1555112 RepID=A0A0K2SLX7_LIMPI|nr:tripartite tricarboxylate transporter permease [Limnochorda pilosa]BAS27829.1 C4-dicarboxylate ABC transporter permease [Limnochorda pilosa]
MDAVLAGLANNFAPLNALLLGLGVLGGIVVGSLPGLTATMGLALLVPFTFAMRPETGLVMLGGLYVGAMYGDAIPASLINTPGTPSAIATSFDGYPLTRQGKAQHALVAAAFSSMVGAVVGGVVLLTLSPPLAEASLRFGPPEYFWMAVFGLTIIGTLASGSMWKGLAGGALGLLISTVGIAPIGGDVRFTFGLASLQAGIDLIVALIGFFCLPQVFRMVEERHQRYQVAEYRERPGVVAEVVAELVGKPFLLIRSSIIGTVVGIVPGAGGNIASLISYNEAARWSGRPEQFGKGIIDGVAASESANNAVAPGAMVPLLTLGIPGSPASAVILGALLLHGMRPGADLYSVHASVTYTFIWAMILAGFVTFGLGMVLSRYIARIINVPINLLVPFIVFLSVIGSFAVRNNLLDVAVMLGFGILGYVTEKLGLQPGPIVLGLILGPIAEQGLVQSLLMGRATGSLAAVFFTRPISIALILLSLVSAAWPVASRWVARSRGGAGERVGSGGPGPAGPQRTSVAGLAVGGSTPSQREEVGRQDG